MKLFTRLALVGAALLAMAGSAYAQSYNTLQVTTGISQRTYEASIVGLAPAASATDFFTLTGVSRGLNVPARQPLQARRPLLL